MKAITTSILAVCVAFPAMAQDTRELDAHEHGVSTVQIAVEGGTMLLDLAAPGMDIVGFEYAPSTDADTAAVATAIDLLQQPGTIVTLPEAAGCSLTSAKANLENEDHHAEDHTDDAENDHEDGEHAEGEHSGNDHAHDDHADEDHAGHDGEEGNANGAGHSAFHASYAFDCTAPEALTMLTFSFFDRFPNAEKIEVQYVTDAGAGSAEVIRDAADLTLE